MLTGNIFINKLYKYMKKFSLILMALVLGSSISLNSQTDLSEGMVKMEITEIGSDNPQVAAQLEMMKGTQTEYYFSEEKSLVNSNMMGGMIKMSYLVNNSDEHLTLLFDAMGQRMMVESTKEERAESEADQIEAAKDITVIYDESDTKEILGYKCIKAKIEGGAESDFPMNFYMYVSPDIKASNKMIQGLQAFEINGFPLEMVLESDQMSMTFTTIELKDNIDMSIFELNTSGYTKMTFKEFSESMGAMGGGMGF